MGNTVSETKKLSDFEHTLRLLNNISRFFLNKKVKEIKFTRLSKHIVNAVWGNKEFLIHREGVFSLYSEMLSALPTMVSNMNQTDHSCEICFDNIDKNIMFLNCGHGPFHLLCIEKWLQLAKTCPFCRVKNTVLEEHYIELDTSERISDAICEYLQTIKI